MKTNPIVVIVLAASALIVSAQQPRVSNTQLHSTPLSMGLSATVDRFRHSHGPLWVGYAVQSLPRTHLSACSSWPQSSEVESECCDEIRLEDTGDNINNSAQDDLPAPMVAVLLRLDQGEVVKVRLAPAGCKLDAGGKRIAGIVAAVGKMVRQRPNRGSSR